MKRRSRKQALICEINITPFTDVILVLLIIFMITTPLMYQTEAKHIKVNLPKAKNVIKTQGRDASEMITLSSEGPLYYNGNVVTLKELENDLTQSLNKNPSLSVVVEVDRLVPFKNVVNVLDILNGLGIERLR
ncbi:MAG TPA: biopolymer transporter ExbD, partial [Candidatus Omnitrophota bacterium]|nr:biopolymer transporter ExbD [Candidatus Omnitrophota bacterium]